MTDRTVTPARVRSRTLFNAQLLHGAYEGDLDKVRAAVSAGADINTIHKKTGLRALHIAVGTNNLPLARYLIEEVGAQLGPDRAGRWPTVIAAECKAGKELCDYIVEAEANLLER